MGTPPTSSGCTPPRLHSTLKPITLPPCVRTRSITCRADHLLSKRLRRPARFFLEYTCHSHDGRERFYLDHLSLFLHTRPEFHPLNASRSDGTLPIEKGQFLPGWDQQQHQSYPHYTVPPDKSRVLRSSLYAHTTHLY